MSIAAKTVVSGEASESDEDNEAYLVISTDRNEKATTVRPPAPSSGVGVVVSGEASESDDEELDQPATPPLTPLQVDPNGAGDSPKLASPAVDPTHAPPKYDSLLHRKLRERNAAFHRHLEQSLAQQYVSGAKELHNISLSMAKSQLAIQDVSHHLRNLTNDLFHLEDKVDIVATCQILPHINIQVPETTSSSARSSPSR